MPYSGPSDESIPDHVPEDDKAQWVKVWNNTYNSCIDDGGAKDTCETKAFKAANGAIENSIRSIAMKRGFFGAISEFVTGMTNALNVFQQRAISVSEVGNAVFEHFYSQGAWLTDLYIENSNLFAVAAQGGKLYRASVDVDETTGDVTMGEMEEVIINFDPVSRNFTSFRTTEDGKVRMLAVSATTVLNKNGAIDSRDLFDSMVDFMERTDKPIPRTFFHLGTEFRTGDVVGMYRDENVLITVTEFDDSELAKREIKSREQDPEYWGDSIEFNPVGEPEMLDVGDGITIPVYRAAIPVAVSTLPAEYACSLYADKFTINRQEVDRMTLTDIEREALIKQFGGDEDEVDKWLENNVSPINRQITESGQITRAEDDSEEELEEESSEEESSEEETSEEETSEGEEETTEEGSTEEETTEEEAAGEDLVLEFTDEMAQEVANSVVESNVFTDFNTTVMESIEGIKETVSELTTTVAELQAASVARAKVIQGLQKSDAEKKQEWSDDLPRNTERTIVLHRPSTDASTEESDERSMQETADETVAAIEAA